MSIEIPDGPFCAACGTSATAWIDHPKHGERPVCADHEGDGEVVSRV